MKCPECRDGKTENCTGWVINDDDEVDVCESSDEMPEEDWSTPEGYDDSPDQGVHRHDGGGAW